MVEDLYINKTKKYLDNICEITYELKYKDKVIATNRCKIAEPPDGLPCDDTMINIEEEADAHSRKILLAGVKVI